LETGLQKLAFARTGTENKCRQALKL